MAGVSVTDVFNTNVTAIGRAILKKMPVNQIFEDNLLLALLFNKDAFPGRRGSGMGGKPVRLSGSREAVINVAYNRSTNIKSFRAADEVPLNVDEVATIAKARWSYYTDAAVLTQQEFLENRGEAARFSIIKARLNQALMTIKERVDTDLWSTGDAVSTGNAGKNIIGLNHLNPADPTTGTCWGLNRATYSWWRPNLVTAGAATSLAKMALAYVTGSGNNGADPATTIITTSLQWQAYHALVSAKQSIMTTKIGDMGFPTLEFMGIPCFWAAGVTAHVWHFLNMRYAVLMLMDGAQFDIREEHRPATQVLQGAWRILFGGQFGFERHDRNVRLLFTG